MTDVAGAASSPDTRSLPLPVADLYDDPRLMPMLRKLVETTCTLVDAVGGSISMVDTDAGRYTKVAELGTACRLGQSFPLSEGVTGEVMSRRGPVVLRAYRDIGSGHLTAGHPAWDGAVVAIPLWWRGDIVAVNVVFAGVARAFAVSEVDQLELVSQVVAPGLVTAMDRELPTSTGPRRSRAVGAHPASGPRSGSTGVSVDEITQGLLHLAQRAAIHQDAPLPDLHVRVYGGGGNPRLLIRREAGPGAGSPPVASASATWQELVDAEAGAVAVHQVRPPDASFPAGGAPEGPPPADPRHAAGFPFSAREFEVASLLARGLSDRAIADHLCLSTKTVEKHVGAVLRKTASTSRTAAVVRCIQHGWLSAGSTV